MKKNKQIKILLCASAFVLGMLVIIIEPVTVQGGPLLQEDMHQINESGFGDRHNSWSWSMQWWKGKVFVGTNRAWECYVTAMHQIVPIYGNIVKYPPSDSDLECTPTPEELPLQAEIWSYDPEIEHWERLYQSPNTVEIPGHPGKFTARNIAFRAAAVFEEPDGTEALYFFGVTSRTKWENVPPPQILRSTDGSTFEAVPQEPGTVLGDLERASFRAATVYNGKLYVLSSGIHGAGDLLEAEYPAGGNDNFRYIIKQSEPAFWVTGGLVQVYTTAAFNGYLYLGLEDQAGFSVFKTDAEGDLPYTFTPVITKGGYLVEQRPKYPPLRPNKPSSHTPLTMHVFKDRLYVGCDKPAELFRINPDDSWDLVVGESRMTPDGKKYPLSGMDAGFNNRDNHHIWRMQGHDGYLYVGTADALTEIIKTKPPLLADILLERSKSKAGFDLYVTPNGWNFTKITTNGFDNPFNIGVRTWTSSPYGVFFGTANAWYGTEVYLAR